MKKGDLVKYIKPYSESKSGIIIKTMIGTIAGNKTFNVLWFCGKIGKNIWDYDLELIT